MNKIFNFLNGKEYVLSGVHGVFIHDIIPYINGYHCCDVKEDLIHEPSEEGKKMPQYQEAKLALGGDCVTNLTDNVELYTKIAFELGYQEESE